MSDDTKKVETTDTPWSEMTPKERRDFVRSKSNKLGKEIMVAEASGDSEAILKAKAELSDLEELIGEDQSLKSIATEGYEIGSVSALEADTQIADEQKSKIKKLLTGDLISDSIKSGVGIFQAISGAAKKKGLVAPKLPQNLRKNATLSTQLNESLVRQKNGDPEIERLFRSKVAEERKVQDAVAQTTGNTGRYVGNRQANAMRQSKLLRDIAADMDRRKTQKRSETNQLIGQSVREDAAIKNLEFRKYDNQQREYSSSLNAAQSQINSGIGNAFQGLSGMSSDISRLYANRGKRKPKDDEEPERKKGLGHFFGNLFSKRYREAHGLNSRLAEQIDDTALSDAGGINNHLIAKTFLDT